jgi:hypothetical protein
MAALAEPAKRGVMRFQKRLLFVLVVVAAVTPITSPGVAATTQQDSTWMVIGRKLAWTMEAPSGWIGGNYSQIQEVRDTTQNATIKTLLGQIWFTARQIDAYLIHTDVSNVTSKTLSSINIDLVEKGFAASDFNAEMWRAFATMDEDNAGGATTKFMESDTLKLGGRIAARGMFETTLPSGGSVYKVKCVVLLDAGRSHMFTFKADRVKALARLKDFDEMLYTLRYR